MHGTDTNENAKQLEIRKAAGVPGPHGYDAKMLEEYGSQWLGYRAKVYGGFHRAADPKARCISGSPFKTFHQG